jgi:hypothetical protein
VDPIVSTLPRPSWVTEAPALAVSWLRPSTVAASVPAAGVSCAKASFERVKE